MSSIKKSRALSVSMSTLTLAAMGAMTFAPVASAVAPSDAFGMSSVSAVADVSGHLVDADAPTTLTVHKYLGAPVAGPSDGTEQPTVGLPTLEGVEFTSFKVLNADGTPVDLTTNGGWDAAAEIYDYTPNTAEIAAGTMVINGTTYLLEFGEEVATGADGTAVFANGGVGLFLVAETIDAGDVITDSDGNIIPSNSVTPAAPFFVTLPMTQPAELDTWMYDVHAYPKNASDSIEKTVQDKDTFIGEDGHEYQDYAYTMDSTITPGLTGAEMGLYVIGDQMHELVTPTAITVAVGGADMVAGTDYQVYVDDVLDGPFAAGSKLEIVMTAAGLDKLAAASAADAAAMVTTTIDVVALTDGGQDDIRNEAFVIPNAPWFDQQSPGVPFDPTDPEVPEDPPTSPPVQSLFAQLNIVKTDAADDTILLEGAEFSIYFDDSGDASCSVLPEPAITTGLTTAADGTVSLPGLQASDFYDGEGQDELQTYCLVETKAPDGYNLLAEPISFTIDAEEGADGFWIVTDTDLDVQNPKTNLGNDLPLTGGAGVAAMGVGGLLLLGAAGGYVAYSRRRNSDEGVNKPVTSA